MENETGFEIGDHVRIHGGFEDGIVGRISDVDLSGGVKSHPRFTVEPMGGRTSHPIGGLNTVALEHLDGSWKEDTGHWEDGVPSWFGNTANLENDPGCELRIRQESEIRFSWKVFRSAGRSVVDQGHAGTLDQAKIHAMNAAVWHAAPKEKPVSVPFEVMEIQRVLDAGSATGEDWFRLQVSGSEKSKHLNITRGQLEEIRNHLFDDARRSANG